MKKRFTATVLVLVMILSLCPVMAEEYADRLYTLKEFIYAIGTNNLEAPDGTEVYSFTDWREIADEDKEVLLLGLKNGIIMGDGDTVRPYDKVLRVEAFVMLSRALDSLTMVTQPLTFSDTPDWARADIDRLSAAGLVKGTEVGVLGANDYITIEQVQLLADRIDRMYVRLEDDYYAAVNGRWLRNNTVPAAHTSWSTVNEADERIKEETEAIIADYANAPTGSTRRSVYNYYLSALDIEKRNAQGAQPVKPYMDMLDAARNTTDIIEVMANIAKDNFMFSLLPVDIAPDELNTEKMLITLYAADSGMNAYYLIEDVGALKAYKAYLVKLLTLAGEDAFGLEDRVEAVVSFQTGLATVALNYYEYLDFEARHNEYDMQSFSTEFYNIDLKLYFETIGIPLPQRFVVEEVRQMGVINSFMTDDNLELLKDYIKVILLKDSSVFLSQDFEEATRSFNNTFYAVEGDYTIAEKALSMTDEVWGMVIGADYMQRCYSDDTTNAIESVTHELIETYKERISELSWLSDSTKVSAVKKLDSMLIKIGGPSGYPEYMDDIVNVAPADGGSLFNNNSKIGAAMLKNQIDSLQSDFDRAAWDIQPHMVNAFYSPLSNEIVLPAGILQEPFYSEDYSYEENLGAIGVVIAHELSHAFDSSGAQYDEKGNISNWWTEADYSEFEALAQRVADSYSKIEVIDGLFVNGDYTLDENIADLGAVSCAIETAKKHEGFDFDKFFRSFAYSWAEVIPEKNLITQLINDEHSPAKVRVNGVLRNFEQFYNTYDIKQGDGMYLPPEDRVGIW